MYDALCLLRGLHCVILQVPPLRVRPADVLDFIRYFMRVVSKEQGVKLTLTPEAERALLAYNFPDNIAVSIKPQNGVRGAAMHQESPCTRVTAVLGVGYGNCVGRLSVLHMFLRSVLVSYL